MQGLWAERRLLCLEVSQLSRQTLICHVCSPRPYGGSSYLTVSVRGRAAAAGRCLEFCRLRCPCLLTDSTYQADVRGSASAEERLAAIALEHARLCCLCPVSCHIMDRRAWLCRCPGASGGSWRLDHVRLYMEDLNPKTLSFNARRVCLALQVPWGERRRLSLHGVTTGTSEAALRGMLPDGAPDLEGVEYAGGRLGSLQFARPEDADAAFATLPVQTLLPCNAQIVAPSSVAALLSLARFCVGAAAHASVPSALMQQQKSMNGSAHNELNNCA